MPINQGLIHIIEFLIPVTISLTCLSVLINKNHKSSLKILVNLVTLFFGLIHGFGFGFYFFTNHIKGGCHCSTFKYHREIFKI